MRIHSLLGLFGLVILAWACSENHRKFNVKTLLTGLGLQVLLALADPLVF